MEINMAQQLDLAKSRLFDRDALAVKNVKLFPGSNRDTTAEQFAGQINKTISQLEAGDYEEVDLDTASA